VNKNSALTAQDEALKFVGLDVHKETIAIAVADSGRAVPRALGVIHNDLDELRKILHKVGSPSRLRVCYEAGPCGYVVYRFLRRLKIDCSVIVPSLIPRRPGDRVKTDRRDALTLARLLRSGELTATWVPDQQHEALRDLVRAREDAIQDHLRARHRLTKFLLRLGVTAPAGVRTWTLKYEHWLDGLLWRHPAQELAFSEYRHNLEEVTQRIARLENELATLAGSSPHARTIAALQAMRGIKLITAVTLVSEIGDITRFQAPRQLMAYAGLVPSEHSSGGRVRRGALTKTGNAHLRRVLVETAWHYRHRPLDTPALRQRQRGVDARACRIAWSAQQRLHKRYCHLTARGKPRPQAVVAVARELLGFIWAVSQVTKASESHKSAA
jgi:transposase